MTVKLLMLADDFSGALDAGVKFSSRGIDTRVLVDQTCCLDNLDPQVLVINTASRHLPAADAWSIVFDIVKQADEAGIPYIFKKTDSVLRGNVGAELSAALAASKANTLSFFPAFPDMNRTTKNGIQYYDGIPIHESVLANDPFDPIACSRVQDIIATQSQVNVVLQSSRSAASDFPEPEKSIVIYDGETNQDMDMAVSELAKKNGLGLLAGCAGLASIVQPYLQLPVTSENSSIPLNKPIFFICGSINPVTRRQIEYAASHGFALVELDPEEQTSPDFQNSDSFQSVITQLRELSRSQVPIILASNPRTELSASPEYPQNPPLLNERRVHIADNLSALLKALLDLGLDYTLMISGGDVAQAFIQQIGCTYLKPEYEIAPGTVVSRFHYNGNLHHLISKSGGFGKNTLLVDMNQSIQKEDHK